MYYTIFKAEIGNICLVGDDNTLSELFLISDIKINNNRFNKLIRNDKVFSNIIKQLEEYFAGNRQTFDIKLNLQGTDFQNIVWNKLLEIPYGETKSYKEIALLLNKPTASRAIGTANSKNPIAIIVPCHRVIRSNGDVSGYAYGKELKRNLLELEERNKDK